MGGDNVVVVGQCSLELQFQSTPPRGGRPRRFAGKVGGSVRQFQSTPPRGGRQSRTGSPSCVKFQSTPPRGGRPSAATWQLPLTLQISVSIHAPAWGATRCEAERTPFGTFQSTAWGAPGFGAARFQSTPPRGGRRRQRNSFRDNNKLSRLREPDPAISEVSYRDDCVLQDSTNVPAEGCALRVRAFSKHERGIGIVGRLCARMLDS